MHIYNINMFKRILRFYFFAVALTDKHTRGYDFFLHLKLFQINIWTIHSYAISMFADKYIIELSKTNRMRIILTLLRWND